jgi:hypothetical protein
MWLFARKIGTGTSAAEHAANSCRIISSSFFVMFFRSTTVMP